MDEAAVDALLEVARAMVREAAERRKQDTSELKEAKLRRKRKGRETVQDAETRHLMNCAEWATRDAAARLIQRAFTKLKVEVDSKYKLARIQAPAAASSSDRSASLARRAVLKWTALGNKRREMERGLAASSSDRTARRWMKLARKTADSAAASTTNSATATTNAAAAAAAAAATTTAAAVRLRERQRVAAARHRKRTAMGRGRRTLASRVATQNEDGETRLRAERVQADIARRTAARERRQGVSRQAQESRYIDWDDLPRVPSLWFGGNPEFSL